MSRLKVKQKRDKWVSNSRVLMGSSRKDPGRNPNFDTEETRLLISLWGDPAVQRTLITSHRKNIVITRLAEKMREYGYSRSTEEVNTRIKNLKCFYNRLKKDIETGACNNTSWKHFDVMDEIMTRSVFSVRPNEVPKPSLKYQLELEQEERMKMAESFSKAEDSSSSADNDDMIENIDAHMDANVSVVMGCADSVDNSLVTIKEEYDDDFEILETPLLIPKNEPVDVDDDDELEETVNKIKTIPESMTPKLTDYVQISNGNTNSNIKTTSSVSRTLVNGNHNTILQSSPSLTSPGMTQSILFAKQPNSMTGSGKISIVPTNFLMHQNKAVPQQIQLRQTPQQRIICTQSNTQPKTGIVTSTADGRMKVLLVNAFQNGKTAHPVAGKESPFTNANLISNGNTLKANTLESSVLKNNVPETSKQTRTEEGNANKDPGMELLFNKLILMQTENNEIQRQRLEIERQRLEFEKSTADKLLAALSSLAKVQKSESGDIANPRDGSVSGEEKTQSSVIVDECNGFTLLTPKLEKMD